MILWCQVHKAFAKEAKVNYDEAEMEVLNLNSGSTAMSIFLKDTKTGKKHKMARSQVVDMLQKELTVKDGKIKGYKSCGRKKGEKRAKYPSCRPTAAQCKTPGKGTKWGKTK